MKKLSFSLFLLLSPMLIPAGEKLPLPPVFLQAKKFAIINGLEKIDLADKAYENIRKWKRYEYVHDPAEADLVLVLSATDRKFLGMLKDGPIVRQEVKQEVNINTGPFNLPLYRPNSDSFRDLMDHLNAQGGPVFEEGRVYFSFMDREKKLVWMGSGKNNRTVTDELTSFLRDVGKRLKKRPE